MALARADVWTVPRCSPRDGERMVKGSLLRTLRFKEAAMSLFHKRESDQARPVVEQESRVQPGVRPYGITEVVHLMRRLPIDENVELVVTVIRNTLESLNVQL